MAGTINKETGSVIDAVLEALDIPYPATVGDEPAWLRCLSNRVVHVVIALRVMSETTAEPEWHLEWLRERLADDPPTYRAWPKVGPAIGQGR